MSGWPSIPPHFSPPEHPFLHSQPLQPPHHSYQPDRRDNSNRDSRGSRPHESREDERGYGPIPLSYYVPHSKLVHRHPQHFPFEQQQRYYGHPPPQPPPSSWQPPKMNGYPHTAHFPPHPPQPPYSRPPAVPLPSAAHTKAYLPQPPPPPPPSSAPIAPSGTIRIGFI